jgi:YhcH/YjgK/YiaL family protein
MAMFGKIRDLAALAHPASRLTRALQLLQDVQDGRIPELMERIFSLAPGQTVRVPIQGDALYLLLQCYLPRPRESGRFEAHARHTDLQFLLAGGECIEVCDARSFPVAVPFDENGNAYYPLGDHPHSRLALGSGTLAVLSPSDAHAPCLRLESAAELLVRKIVVKVKDAHLIETALAGWAAASGDIPGKPFGAAAPG